VFTDLSKHLRGGRLTFDPMKTALATLGTAFLAGVGWTTLKKQVTQTREDLNNMGKHRVKKVEDQLKEIAGRLDEQREAAHRRQEQAIEREARMREELRELRVILRLHGLDGAGSAERPDRTK